MNGESMGQASGTKRQVLWGLIFILIGLTALLVQVGALPADLAQLWPVLVIALGVMLMVRAISSTSGRGFAAGVVATTAGGFLLADQIWQLPDGFFFPLLLLALGIGLILRPGREDPAR